MKQRLINYLIVLAGLFSFVGLVSGFAQFSANVKGYTTLEEVSKLSEETIKGIFDVDKVFLLNLQPFNQVNIVGYVLPIIFSILAIPTIFGYLILSKRSRAKLEFPVNKKYYKHAIFTTVYAMFALVAIAWIISYIMVGINFYPKNVELPKTFQANSQEFKDYFLIVSKQFEEKRVGYIISMVFVLTFTVAIVGLMNFYSLKITLEQTAKATHLKYQQEKNDPTSDYFEISNNLNEYEKFVIDQKNNFSRDLFEKINDQEKKLRSNYEINDINDTSVEKLLEIRKESTLIILDEENKKQSSRNEYDDDTPSIVSSGNF